MIDSRTMPKLLAISFELTLCIGYFMTLLAPIISKMPKPCPLVFFWIFTGLCALMMLKVGPNGNAEKFNVVQ